MVDVALSTVATVASALSPDSFLFPFSDSGFASLSASSSSRPFALPPPPLLPSSVALSSSSFSSLASSSFSSSLPFSPPLPPSPAFPSPLAPPASSSFPSSSSLSASAALRPPPGFAPLPPPPPPPGFAPLPPSLSPPLSSSSFPSASAVPSFSSSLPPGCVSFLAGLAPPVLSSSSFPLLDFASYQASMLGLSQDYQSLARWYFLSGGSDFRAYLSAFYPHLSSDASRDFSSGSYVFFSALRAVASSVPLPMVSSAAPPLPSVAPASSTRTPAPLPTPVSAPSGVTVSPLSLPPVSQLGGGLYALGSAQLLPQAPPGVSSLSTASTLLSVPPPAVPSSSLPASRPPGVSGFYPLLPLSSSAWPVSSAPGLGSTPLVSVAPSLPAVTLPGTLVFTAASALPPFCSAPLGSVAGISGFASASAGSTFGFVGSAPQPGPDPAYPPLSGPSVPPSAPPLSDFNYGNDDAFAPGFGDPDSSGAAAPDPEAPVLTPLSDSARAEVRRMYQYLVDLFPQSAGSSQAPLPPRALFEEFFAAPPSPHQPVFLSWFELVRSTLSDTDARILSLLASGRPESALLPPRQSQYSVGSASSLGSAAPVNPSLLAMFECPLRPSFHLGVTLREASLLESSSRALSEAQSHAMWLLSGLLGFVRLQGFSPSDSLLFNTLVSSLSRCLAHQASVSASLTAFMGIKRRQFYLSHLPAYFLDVNKSAMLAAPVVCADSLFLESDVTRLLSDTQTSSSLKSQQALVDVASNRSGPRRRRFSPARSPSRRCRRDSGCPSRGSKRVRFDSPAPSSALKPPNKGFQR